MNCTPAMNLEHIRQLRPDAGLGFQVKVHQPFYAVPSSFGSALSGREGGQGVTSAGPGAREGIAPT
jgi:hypothetical protein